MSKQPTDNRAPENLAPDIWCNRNHLWQQHYHSLTEAKRSALAKEQTPKALVFGCVDSRVNPSQVLQAEPGELLVHRNMGNICCEPGAMATMEFGVSQLNIRTLILLGHHQCGAVQAAMQSTATLDLQGSDLQGSDLQGSDSQTIRDKRENSAHLWVENYFNVDPKATWQNACRNHLQQQHDQLIASQEFQRLNTEYGPLEVLAYLYDIESGLIFPLKDH